MDTRATLGNAIDEAEVRTAALHCIHNEIYHFNNCFNFLLDFMANEWD
jgi:hypothetical protein